MTICKLCGGRTINTDCFCDKCKDLFLKRVLEDEKRMTTRLFDSCFKEGRKV